MPAQLTIWEHPDSYAGFSPDGDILVVSRTRDSDAMARTNWNAARERLCVAAGVDSVAADDSTAPVYDWRASHWACGWVEYLMVSKSAPAAVIAEAQAIADDLDSYPALDEDAWSNLEWEEATDYWASLSVRDRAEMIRDYAPECSLFAARRPWLPENENGGLYDVLRG